MAKASIRAPQPQSGSRRSNRLAASEAPPEAAKAYATLVEGKEYEIGRSTKKRASGSVTNGLGCITRFFSTSEVANPTTNAVNPATAAQRPTLPPTAASIPNDSSQTR